MVENVETEKPQAEAGRKHIPNLSDEEKWVVTGSTSHYAVPNSDDASTNSVSRASPLVTGCNLARSSATIHQDMGLQLD